MLRFYNRTNILKINRLKSTLSQQYIIADFGNSIPLYSLNVYSVNNIISRNLFSFNSGNLKYLFSTFNKKNLQKTQNTSKKQTKQQKNQHKQSKQQQYLKHNQSNFKAKQQKLQNKNKQNYQKEQIVQHTPSQQTKYEMSPDILQFNKEVNQFIESNLPKIRVPQQQGQKNDVKITTNFLSNLYKFMNLKGDFLQVNPQRSLSPQNRRRISQLIRLKQRQLQQFSKQENEDNNMVKDEQKLVIYHEQLCNTLYLSSIISDKKRFNNIVSEFLSLLSIPISSKYLGVNNKKVQFRFKFVMNESQLKVTDNRTSITNHHLPIVVSKIFPPTLFIMHDTFPLQIVKNVAEKRSTQQLLSSLRCLSKLLTIKQLKTLDNLIEQHFLAPTEYKMKKQHKSQPMIFNSTNSPKDNSTGGQPLKTFNNDHKILNIQQLSRLASILSQLNLNGNSIRACQHIFSSILHKQTINHKQVLQTLIQHLLSSTQTHKDQITMSFVINLPPTQLKFDLLIKFFIALAEIGAVDREFQQLLGRLIVMKFRLKQLIDYNKQCIKDGNVWRQLTSRYCVNSKEVSILLSTLHKFKKGTQVMITPYYNNSNNHTGRIQLKHTNVWLQIYRYYTQTQTIPDEFIFPILSGLYRSFGSMIINYMSSYYQKRSSLQRANEEIQRICGVMSRLTLRLYQVDKQVSYLSDLELQKLIQLVIVVNLGANLNIMRTINRTIIDKDEQGDIKGDNINKLKNISIDLSYEFINKILVEMNKRLQQQQNQNKNHNDQQQQQNDQQQSMGIAKNMNKSTNQSNSQQSQIMNPLNPQLIKQQKNIQSLLQFYLLFTKAHLQMFRTTNVSTKTSNKNKKTTSINNNSRQSSSQNIVKDSLQEILKEIKTVLKKNKINPQTSQLVTILIKKATQLSYSLKSYQQYSLNIHQIGTNLQQFANNLQSFIGFNSQQQLLQYENQLQSNLIIKSIFPYLQEDSTVDQSLINAVTKRLLKSDSNSNNQKFSVQKILINYTIIEEEIIRINLIDSEEDYKMYQISFLQ